MKNFTCLLGLLAFISCFTPSESHRGYHRHHGLDPFEEKRASLYKILWNLQQRPAPSYPGLTHSRPSAFIPGQIRQPYPQPGYPWSISSQSLKNPWDRRPGHIPSYLDPPKRRPCRPVFPHVPNLPAHPSPEPTTTFPPSPSPTPETQTPTTVVTTTAGIPTTSVPSTEFTTAATASVSVEPTTTTLTTTPIEDTTQITTNSSSTPTSNNPITLSDTFSEILEFLKTIFNFP